MSIIGWYILGAIGLVVVLARQAFNHFCDTCIVKDNKSKDGGQ